LENEIKQYEFGAWEFDSMGRQINFYMEEITYKQIVEKALQMGFVVLYQECVGWKRGAWEYQYHWYDAMPDFSLDNQHYFYNPSLGGFRNTLGEKEQLIWSEITEQKLALGTMFAPMIEARCSSVLNAEKAIVATRLYVRSDCYDSESNLIKQDELLMKHYAALTRAVKNFSTKREIKCKSPYSDCTRKEYMTDYLFSLYESGYTLR
jgi:hypothetical protein